MVTVRFDDPATARPAALTVAALRPDLFRIVIDSPAGDLPVLATSDAFDESAGSGDIQAAPGDATGINDTQISFLQS